MAIEASPDKTRVAFGSCADQRRAQPIWSAIAAVQPAAFVFLGDNVYADSGDPAVLGAAYADLASVPGFAAMRASATPMFATWDDHDYGDNDGHAGFPDREASEEAFEAFWGGDERLGRPGVYDVGWVSDLGHRIQIVLLDLRSFRSEIAEVKRTPAMMARGVGPYRSSPEGTMLGADQWAWLAEALAQPADLRLIASSLPVIAEGTGWEIWANLPHERQRLLDLVADAAPVVILSGDTHWGAISTLDGRLLDVTSSGLNKSWPTAPPQPHRVGQPVLQPNFGVVEVTWGATVSVEVQLRDARGRVVRSGEVSW